MRPNDIIVKDPDILGGTPVFRGTRVPLQALLDYLEAGQTLDEFLDDFPTVSKDAAVAVLELAQSLSSANWDEGPAGRVPPTQVTARTARPWLPDRPWEAGLAGQKNGRLLSVAESAGYELFLTMDKGLQYQQNLIGRRIAILVIRAKSNRLMDVLPHVDACRSIMSWIQPGQVIRVGE
jgi:uncharacterized protein (DUF433 family)